jgi:SAM-dependent methyltransferase
VRDLQRSKRYYLNASLKQTGAKIDESCDPGAVERRKFIMEISKPKGKAALSLGCGLGRFLRDYAKHGAMIVVGLDINRGNLKLCKEIGVDLVLGDAENLPFQDNTFDVIDCEATMEEIAEPIKTMKEISRILKQDTGRSFVTWHIYRWTNVLTKRTIRLRFGFYVRDLILTSLGRCVGRSIDGIAENRLLKVLSAGYGTYRNEGFSYPQIQYIYEEASMKMVLLKIYHHVIFIASKRRHLC